MNSDLAILHSYLCADGYVIKNPITQKIKYYNIGFRNYNQVLLNDFHDRFHNYFNKKSHFCKDGRVRIGSKEIYTYLTNNFGSFYSKDWSLPKLNEENLKL